MRGRRSAGDVVMRYANAGHLPPLLVRSDGSVDELSGGRGPLAGATGEAEFAEATARLAPGDLLLLYTDGVTEVCTRDLTLGERELRAVFARTAGMSAETVAAAVARRAVELQGAARRDDGVPVRRRLHRRLRRGIGGDPEDPVTPVSSDKRINGAARRGDPRSDHPRIVSLSRVARCRSPSSRRTSGLVTLVRLPARRSGGGVRADSGQHYCPPACRSGRRRCDGACIAPRFGERAPYVPDSRDRALVSLQLPGRPEAASAARKALAALNGDLHLISQARLSDAQLLLTEVVTNAIRHAGADAVTVAVRATARTLRVEVANRGAAFDPAAIANPSLDRPGGWGLRIVDVLAHRWGVEQRDERVAVWFEIDRPRTEAAVDVESDAPPPPGLSH